MNPQVNLHICRHVLSLDKKLYFTLPLPTQLGTGGPFRERGGGLELLNLYNFVVLCYRNLKTCWPRVA